MELDFAEFFHYYKFFLRDVKYNNCFQNTLIF